MNRRQALKLLLSTGALATMPISFLRAANSITPDRFLIMMSARGGWDVTSICDPKGNVQYATGSEFINRYTTNDIRTAGNLRYAPLPTGTNFDVDWMDYVFQNHGQYMTVINGINCLTGSHAQGSYYFSSGQSFADFPVIGALQAAPYASQMAMPFYAANAHAATGGEVSAVQVNSSNTLNKLLKVNPNQATSIHNMLVTKRKEIIDHLGYNPATVSKAETWRQFKEADISSTNIAKVLDYLPATTSNGTKFQSEFIAALLASGQCAAAAFGNSGGFDTHTNNDARTAQATNNLFDEINHLWNELERHGIASKTTLMIGSEFGRTPWFNNKNGKDHWATGSIILMSKGIPGNRIIGSSNDALKPNKVNPNTLAIDNVNGIEITIQHVHRALRNHLGLQASNLDAKYPIPVESLNLFS